jgi:hypothetical protein
MPIMALALRVKLQVYLQGLLARVLRVRCPMCRAAPKKPCQARWNGVGKPRAVKWCHGGRHNEAKRVGLLKGRYRPPLRAIARIARS